MQARRAFTLPAVRGGSAALLAGAALLAVLLGIGLRFANLDARSYTNDEATTSIRSAGSSLAEWSALFDGRVRTVTELRRYQTLVPGRSSADTVRALALEDPQHPPLYYVLERGWTAAVGDGVAARRALSALFGTLAIGAVFLVGAQAGRSWRAGAVCAALMALSPFFVAYSQHAREYALWALEVLLASWLLLRALRAPAPARWWIGYGLVTALGLYTALLYAAVLPGHAVLVAVLARGRRQPLAAWAAASAAALIAFVPWLVAVVRGAGLLTNNQFLGARLSPLVFAAKWIFNAGLVFVDLEYRYPAALVLVAGALLICVAAAWAALRPQRVPGGIVAGALIVPPAVAMLVLDFVHHESRSTASRYLTPVWSGLVLLVGLALAAWLGAGRPVPRALGAAALAFLLAVGGVSVLAETRDDWSWVDRSVAPIRPVAALIDARPGSLVTYKSDPGAWDFKVMQLANVLRGDVRIRLVPPGMPLLAAGGEQPAFLLDPSPAVLAEARRTGLRVSPAYVEDPDTGAGLTGALRRRARTARRQDDVPEELTSLWRVAP